MPGLIYAPVGRLVEVLGVASALKLVERFGGRRLYVPQPERLKAEGALVATIGFEAATKLAWEWRGMEVMLPMCAEYLRRARARAIHAEPRTLSVRDIAAKYGITERYAFKILADGPPADDAADPARIAQGSLFPES